MKKKIKLLGSILVIFSILFMLSNNNESKVSAVIQEGDNLFEETGNYDVFLSESFVGYPGNTFLPVHPMVYTKQVATANVERAFIGFMVEKLDDTYPHPRYGVNDTWDILFNGTVIGTKTLKTKEVPGSLAGESSAFMQTTDITDLVKQYGEGEYKIANSLTAHGRYFLVIVEEDPSFDFNKLVINDYFYSNIDNIPEKLYLDIRLPKGFVVDNSKPAQFMSLATTVDGIDDYMGYAQSTKDGVPLNDYKMLVNPKTRNPRKLFNGYGETGWTGPIPFDLADGANGYNFYFDMQPHAAAPGPYGVQTEVAGFAIIKAPAIPLTVQKDVMDTKGNNNGSLQPDEIFSYKIEVANYISLSNQEINLTDTLSDVLPFTTGKVLSSKVSSVDNDGNVTIVSESTTPVDATAINKTYSILPSGKYIYEFDLQMKSSDNYTIAELQNLMANGLTNTASVHSVTLDLTSNDTADISFKIPKLVGTKVVNDATGDGVAEAGEELNYTMYYTNIGNVPAKDVIVQDILDDKEFTNATILETKINDVLSDGNIKTGINVGDIDVNQNIKVELKIKLADTLSVGNKLVENQGSAKGSNTNIAKTTSEIDPNKPSLPLNFDTPPKITRFLFLEQGLWGQR